MAERASQDFNPVIRFTLDFLDINAVLPNENTAVLLVYTPDGHSPPYTEIGYLSGGRWFSHLSSEPISRVLAWRELNLLHGMSISRDTPDSYPSFVNDYGNFQGNFTSQTDYTLLKDIINKLRKKGTN